MLWNILQAHGGTLPDDVIVAFANTGKEREETLRFVHECGSRWGVDIHWLEWRDSPDGFERVGFNSASRNGEPFAQIIAKKQRLPNWKERWCCTEFLKVRPLFALAALQGWEAGSYAEVIGLRYDEGHRVLKGLGKADEKGRMVRYPLAKAKVVKADVMAFWKSNDFDLGLEPWEGNCDLCFLKGRGIRKEIIRRNPSAAHWWADKEFRHKGKQARGWFDKRDSIAGLAAEVAASPTFFDDFDPEEYDVECGFTCGGDDV